MVVPLSSSSDTEELRPKFNGREDDNGGIPSDSDRMVLDESSYSHAHQEKEEILSQPKKQQQQPTVNKQPVKKETTNKPQETESKKANGRKGRQTRKKLGEDPLSCPRKIIDSILSRSSFQTANLSQYVEEKFYEAKDYKTNLAKTLKDVKYVSTVEDLGDRFSTETSIKPLGWLGRVNLEPSVFLSMNCIHEKPPKRERNRYKAGKKKQGNKNIDTTNHQKKQNEDKIKSEPEVENPQKPSCDPIGFSVSQLGSKYVVKNR